VINPKNGKQAPARQSPGSLLWFRLLHRGLLGALLCAAAPLANAFGVSLAQKRPRRLVIGHVLLRGDARNGAADQAIVTASALDEQ
jgi:hypothetical protein